jgi:transcriptional regulatory protein LEU3
MPIVRHRDPNKLYESGAVLFWTIIMIACRRYARTPNALSFLTEAVRNELFSTISKLPLTIHSVNALILVSTWVFPDVRFISDPTSIFSGVIMNAALLLGIHTGKGSHPEYSIGMFQNNFTNEEAHYTWAGYCITSQRQVPRVSHKDIRLMSFVQNGRVSGTTPCWQHLQSDGTERH